MPSMLTSETLSHGWSGKGWTFKCWEGMEGRLFEERILSAEPGRKAGVSKEENVFLVSQVSDWFYPSHSKKEVSLLWGLYTGFKNLKEEGSRSPD